MPFCSGGQHTLTPAHNFRRLFCLTNHSIPVLVTISGRVLSAANEDIPAENRHAEHGKVARTFMETRTSAESALCGTWGATRPRKPVMSTANHRQATYTSTAPRMS